MTTILPEAKNRLSNTIEKLRQALLEDFHNAADGAYRLSIPINKAGLSDEARTKRKRLETWLDEQARGENRGKKESLEAAKERHYRTAIKLAAATFLNRIVVIKHMEAIGLIKSAVVTGGWQSPGYREFCEFAPDLIKDETEGFGVLLQLLYDELALDLPGLFGDVGVSGLFPIQASTLKAVIEALDDPVLESAWTDDTTLGWVYQFWNDTERKALDAKVNNQGKIERHEIAAKTQLFTERYMVEWLLQNSLNNQWLAICEKNGWTPDARSEGTLDALEKRREEWRAMRDSGEVTAEARMPIENDQEQRWKYWVNQPIIKESVEAIPESISKLKILDPAVGSGHFLVIAFDLLAAFYEEEARHCGEEWTSRQIAEGIIENNLHGVDIDLRAVQIAAAALLLKARSYCKEALPRYINLVASNLGLASLPDNDPAVKELKREVQLATGLPEALTDQIIYALKGADYLGSLLKIDEAVDNAINEHEKKEKLVRRKFKQGNLFEGLRPKQTLLSFDEAKVSLLAQLDKFLAKCTSGNDLGLRLRGQQLSAGLRFIRLVKQETYDLVVANPPYLGGAKIEDKSYIDNNYFEGKADLYAVFLQRGIELAKQYGLSAMITMRGWMFIKDYEKLRAHIIDRKSITCIADLHFGAFPEMKDVSVTMSIMMNAQNKVDTTNFVRPVKSKLVVRDLKQIFRNISGLMAPHTLYLRPIHVFKVIEGWPIIYWWDDDFLKKYAETSKLDEVAPVRQGLASSSNNRFIRKHWEILTNAIFQVPSNQIFSLQLENIKWVPYVKGSSGKTWIEPISDVIIWQNHGLSIKVLAQFLYGSYTRTIKNENHYFQYGVAFSSTGSKFSARIHRYKSIFDVKGQSVFPDNIENTVCLMNSQIARNVLEALNPTISFQVGDAKRLPLFPIESSHRILAQLDKAFTEHEAARETSVEFKDPGSSAWNYAQKWAENAVDRPEDAPLPDYNPVYDHPPVANHISYAIGIASGRFGANGEGIFNDAPDSALPSGILYLSSHSENDSLKHPASQQIINSWSKYGESISKKATLKNWLMQSFFKDVHLNMYEKRPVYFPLSSQRKNFVAFISIHRWENGTLKNLLADYLIHELNQIEGELQDLNESRRQGNKKFQSDAEDRYNTTKVFYEELKEFVDLVRQCAEKGPPPAKAKDIPRETDALFRMDLDDGVMINSAALWPLLEPQWKQPKTWWSELCNAKGRKDYDWSHLAARYFPKRVDEKCKKDPSLAVAHGCFWKYHPEKAYQWELRLQDEIVPDFTIDEKGSDALRVDFEEAYPDKVKALIKAENKRREKKRKKEENQKFQKTTDPLFMGGES